MTIAKTQSCQSLKKDLQNELRNIDPSQSSQLSQNSLKKSCRTDKFNLTAHKILTTKQRVFIRGIYTSAVVQLTDFIIDQLEETCSVDAMLLDFNIAFNFLSHSLLIQKTKAWVIEEFYKTGYLAT